MDPLCPQCKLPLALVAPGKFRCTAHKISFDVLFARRDKLSPQILPTNDVAAEAASQCKQHPSMEAVGFCGNCQAPICETCSFPQTDGSSMCPSCVTNKVPVVGTGMQLVVPMAEGEVCIRHEEVQATTRCFQCASPICPTCDFALPGGIHLCPTCATTPQSGLTGKRKGYAIWSLSLAIWCTITTAVVMSGVFADSMNSEVAAELWGFVFMLVIVIPTLIGLALGVSSFERGVKNAALSWVGTIWNGLILACWILSAIVGTIVS